MKELRDQLIERTKSLTNNRTLYVIKGYEFEEKLDFYPNPMLFSILENTTVDYGRFVEKIMHLIETHDSFFLHYHQFVSMFDKGLHGIFHSFGYQVVMVDFNFYDHYYATHMNKILYESLKHSYLSEEENFVQHLFGYLEASGEYMVYSYNSIEYDFDSIIYWTQHQDIDEKAIPVTHQESNHDIYASMEDAALVATVSKNLDSGKDTYLSISSKQEDNILLKFIVRSIIQSTSKCYRVISEADDKDSVASSEYLKILGRLTPNPEFRKIRVYNNPEYGDTRLVEISQSIIIDEIYKNAIKAYRGEFYHDTFMTASTGAGKSIIFQIPAIKLAEEYGLLTLVVTPLIGLMNDQVNNLSKITDKAATINSEYTPYEKSQIKQRIMSNEISILYLSPETLLSNSDIKTLIGNRDIGLMVIDEAHTVTTWGKSFRPDYWYLGDHIKTLKKYNPSMSFPIAAFTATATLGGPDDMYYEIVSDLALNVKRPYIGEIKRSNISFDIVLHSKQNDYRDEKDSTVQMRLAEYLGNHQKTLTYFPFVSQIRKMYGKISAAKHNLVGKYYGGADKIVKNQTMDEFRTGEKTLVLATKAFGMGIDIDDIENVYHYAPTGNLADYVQEIGRMARRKDIRGVAATDFFDEDFRYIKQLHGLSSIKNFEVIGVVSKILDLYKTKKTRNFLVSSEEFAHIFQKKNDEEIDNRLKTVLLIIRKDLELTRGFHKYALIFKPRSMFTKGLFMIFDKDYPYFVKIGWSTYLSVYKTKKELQYKDKGDLVTYMGNVYELNFKGLWEDKFKEMSFAQFKHDLFEDKLKDIHVADKLNSKVWLEIESLHEKQFQYIVEQFKAYLESVCEVLDNYRTTKKHFSYVDFAAVMMSKHRSFFSNKAHAEMLTNSSLYLLDTLELHRHPHGNRFLSYNENTEKYNVKNINYNGKRDELIRTTMNSFKVYRNDQKATFLRNNANDGDKMRSDIIIVMAQMLELLGLARFKIKSGDRPEYFIRVNSIDILERIASSSYQSETVNRIYELHMNSINIMNHFFTKLTKDDERWSMIEQYFLGEDIKV